MSTQGAVGDISDAVTAAVDAAASAYDLLAEELKGDDPSPAVVLEQSARIWNSSLKAWANLVLAPGRLAAEIMTGGK
jgi:hypothetical protein